MTFTILSREDASSERIAEKITQALEKKGLVREDKHPDFIFFCWWRWYIFTGSSRSHQCGRPRNICRNSLWITWFFL